MDDIQSLITSGLHNEEQKNLICQQMLSLIATAEPDQPQTSIDSAFLICATNFCTFYPIAYEDKERIIKEFVNYLSADFWENYAGKGLDEQVKASLCKLAVCDEEAPNYTLPECMAALSRSLRVEHPKLKIMRELEEAERQEREERSRRNLKRVREFEAERELGREVNTKYILACQERNRRISEAREVWRLLVAKKAGIVQEVEMEILEARRKVREAEYEPIPTREQFKHEAKSPA